MAWLVRDGQVVAPLEVAESMADRTRGLLGRRGIDGALLLRPATSVHTLGMGFDIDVAFCSADLVVLDIVRMRRWRLGLPRLRARSVLEAEAGAFDRWHLRPGDRLEVRP